MKSEKVAIVDLKLTQQELEVLFYIVDDWRTMKSDGQLDVIYPNHSTSSTRLIQTFDLILREMRQGPAKRLLDKPDSN
jgi:hypothetical protein